MAFDIIITNKIVEELQNIIGYKIDRVHQPNKNTIIFTLYKAGINLALLTCISSNNYRVHLTTHQYQNPETAPNFCMLLRKHLVGFKIKKIYTYNLERIIFIELENTDNPDKTINKKLIIELMGKHSNIILTNENDIILDSLRHTSTEENAQRDIYPTCRYLLPKPNNFNKHLQLSTSIVSNVPDNYTSLNSYLDDLYFQKESDEIFNGRKNNLINIVSNTYKKHQKRLDNMNKKLSDCVDMDKYKLYGELITANLYQIPNRNIDSITLCNYYDNNNLITIPLDERYSPSHNCKLYFKKYSKLKNALEIVNIQKHDTLNDLNYIQSVLFAIESSTDLESLKLIEEEMYDLNNHIFTNSKVCKKNNKNKHSKNVKNKSLNFNPLIFNIEDYKIYVGRNNKENDFLTTKIANKNDVWFHVQNAPGSHVVLKTHDKELVPDNILIETAKLAAIHSKFKQSSSVLVDYCPISHIKKPSGSKPGFVIYKNHKTIKL